MTSSDVASNSEEMEKLLARSPVLPVTTMPELEIALPLARALKNGGLNTIEVTLRTPCALTAIELIKKELPELCIGGGTVTSVEQLEQLHDIGAGFAVSPGLMLELLRRARELGIPYLPGVASVSELMVGVNEGYRCFKFFPAVASGGVETLKSLAGPFSNVKFCPTGGINQNNFADFFALSNVVSVGGSWLAPQSLIDRKDWQGIESLSRSFLAKLKISQSCDC